MIIPGVIAAFRQQTIVDPYWGNVVLLMHMDENLVDEVGHTVVASGDAHIGATDGVFSGAAVLDGTGDYITVQTLEATTFAGDFTIEFLLKQTSSASDYFMIYSDGSSLGQLHFVTSSGGSPYQLVLSWMGIGVLQIGYTTLNTWHHVAVCRSGTTISGWLDGVKSVYTLTNGSSPSVDVNLYPSGNSYTGPSLQGMIDELRITGGVARYSGNFTPPTSPFPTY